MKCRTAANNAIKRDGGETSWPRSPEIARAVVAAYESGLSAGALAVKHGVAEGTVMRLLRRSGVKIRHRNASTPAKLKKGGRVTDSKGYIWLLLRPDDPLYPEMAKTQFGQGAGRYALEHRVVMARHLGRPLYGFENVHHKNGQRASNELENLELWVRPQPSGQRVADLVAFVSEFYPLELERLGWVRATA